MFNERWSPGDEPELHADHDTVVEHPLIAQVFEEALKALHGHGMSISGGKHRPVTAVSYWAPRLVLAVLCNELWIPSANHSSCFAFPAGQWANAP